MNAAGYASEKGACMPLNRKRPGGIGEWVYREAKADATHGLSGIGGSTTEHARGKARAEVRDVGTSHRVVVGWRVGG
jgi:hypothetical protein